MKKLGFLLLILTTLAMFSNFASGDTLKYDGLTFNVSLSNSGKTVTMTVTDGTGSSTCESVFSVTNCYLGSVTVKGFATFTLPLTTTQNSTYWDNGVEGPIGSNNCNNNNHSAFVCWDSKQPGALLNGKTYTFTATINAPFTSVGQFSVQADLWGGGTFVKTGPHSNFLVQISQDVPKGNAPPAPEPASLLLLGSGLLGLTLRRLRK